MISVLWSIAIENATNDLTFSFSWLTLLLKSIESSVTRSVTVFLIRLMLAKEGCLSEHMTCNLKHACFYKLPIQKWFCCIHQLVGNNVAGSFSPINDTAAAHHNRLLFLWTSSSCLSLFVLSSGLTCLYNESHSGPNIKLFEYCNLLFTY